MRPLADILIHMQIRYPFDYVNQRVLTAAGFSAHDLSHLVQLKILSCRVNNFDAKEYRIRYGTVGKKTTRGTTFSWAKKRERDRVRTGRHYAKAAA
jgi:hypothetical protein